MPLPKNLTAYSHVKQVLDAALSHNRVRYTLPSPAHATRWRQEAYYFRKLSQNAGITLYDNFIMKVSGPVVIIEKRDVVGELTTDSGVRIKPVAIEPEFPDELERAAFDVARKLGLEIDDDKD